MKISDDPETILQSVKESIKSKRKKRKRKRKKKENFGFDVD